eukprot:6547186-Alexandrium_andersonii.AAC.1
MGLELTQRTVAEFLTPDRVSSVSALQPALLRPKEHVRDLESSGHPLGDAQRTVALKGLLPQALLDRLDDIKDALNAFELKLKWVERQVERDHARALTDKSRSR